MAVETFPVAGAPPRRALRKRVERVLGRDWMAAWLFFAPTGILLFAIIAWPFAQGVYVGFTKTIGSSVQVGPWIGLKNYTDLLGDKQFWFSLGLTVKYTLLVELFKPPLGVIAALLIHNLRRYKILISALILSPFIVPTIVQALIWRAMFNPVFGALNHIVVGLGLSDNGWPWLGDPTTAFYSIAIVNIWAGIPFFAITNLAGLKSVDPDLYS